MRDVQQPIIEINDQEALDFATGLVDPERSAGKSATLRLHQDLKNENPGFIFTLCVLIASACENQQRKSGRRMIAAAEVSPQGLAVAARAILNWPDGLSEVLPATENFRAATKGSEAHSFVGLCKHSGVLNASLMTAVSKAVMLSRVGEKLPRWLRRLEVITDGTGKDNRSAIAEFAAVASTGPFIRATSASKLPPIALYKCYLRGLCGPLSESSGKIGPQIATWVAGLQFDHVPTARSTKRTLPLTRFVNVMFNNAGDVWPHVIEGVLDESLPVKRVPGLGMGLSSLCVTDFVVWQAFLQKAQGVVECADFPLTSPEIAFYLNMSLGAAQTLFDLTKITTFNDLKVFMRDFVLLADLADLSLIKGKPIDINVLWRRLNKAGLRTKGQRFIARAPAIGFLGLD
ncbi:MAG TPA: hypothetical protein VGC14_03980 [Rhizobium sp.]